MSAGTGRPRAELQAAYSAYELRQLELAEHVCPWGETAASLRTLYLAATVRAVLGDEKAAQAVRRLERVLLGLEPKRRRRDK